MSSFAGLSTALSALTAQRRALEVAGQNLANAATPGYTRQRAELSAVPAAGVASMFAAGPSTGAGVRVGAVVRLGDAFADARARVAGADAAALQAVADAWSRVESGLGALATTGTSTQLATLWGAWQDLANAPDSDSARAVLLARAGAVTDAVAARYAGLGTAWQADRTTTAALVERANTAAARVADLNARILQVTNAGGSANELADSRDVLVDELAELLGATTRLRADGQLDVLVGGNLMVEGAVSRTLTVTGATTFAHATGWDAGAPAAVGVAWSARPEVAAGVDGGRVAGLLAALAPADGSGAGGPYAQTAARLDAFATGLAGAVNALHATAVTRDGTAGGDFFALDATRPPALGLSVAVTDPAAIAVGTAGAGGLDGSVGERIAGLAGTAGGPDATWSALVLQVGSRGASATARAEVATAMRDQVVAERIAATAVDTDEESVALLAHQRAYAAAARVLTAVDEMLDTLINRTGVVGR